MVLKWGIVSAGKISNDFTCAMKNLPKDEHEVIAVAARDKARADNFAKIHNIPTAYGSYEEIAANPNIDVVYVGVINTQHLSVCKTMLESGKHILCEKPLCMNYKEAEKLIKIAKSKSLFLMEAVWSRFFPVYDKLRLSLEKEEIGDVVQLTANFGLEIYSERVKQKQFGGGVVLDLGVYTIQLAMLVFGQNTPFEITSVGHLNQDKVDESCTCIIKYPKGKTATTILHSIVRLENDAYIYGTKGFIKIHQPFWCPTKITVNGEKFEYPLPDSDKGRYNYTNSAGLNFQAKEVYRCIKQGLLESPLMSHEDSLIFARIEDTIRSQLGVKFEVDE
ncbi:trans-1,2-dihydrobenzene-1,2-diol dehydrogenase-like [Lycorma delicatula]|uniref:trans-1,2-dihydrobenzene-1,2-diol dehydrogenase-like n=1 Tax=Lycorma delicatula TaxID=130591 RepID=UPI003F519794